MANFLLIGAVPWLAQADDAIVEGGLSSTDWIRAGAFFALTLAVSIGLYRVCRRGLSRALGSGFAGVLLARFIGYAAFLIGVFYTLNDLGVRVGPLLGALGLGGLVVALALQRFAENFISAIFIQTRRPFIIGETVRLGDQVGSVLDVDSRTTVLKGLDGEIIRVPNSDVLNSTIINLTRRPQRRSNLTVGVAYGTNLDDAAAELFEAANLVESIHKSPLPIVRWTAFGASSIDAVIFYWHASDIATELEARSALITSIDRQFKAANITIAFPQLVLWPGDELRTSSPSERNTDDDQ